MPRYGRAPRRCEPGGTEPLAAVPRFHRMNDTTEPKGGGLRGRDKQQSGLRDTRQGAYDPAGNQTVPDTSQPTPRERAQPGTAVQGEPIPTEGEELPERLKRRPTGPYYRDRGRVDE